MTAVDVQVLVFALDVAAEERARLQSFLAPDERDRAARFVFDRDRERFVVGRGRLREVLAQRLGRAPAALAFSYATNGKPSVGGVAFNLSHSNGVAALGVSAVELGVDVECVRPLKEDVAERFFSRTEIDALARLPTDEQLTGFYRCWTRKEAIIKATGEGLSHPLHAFAVSVDMAPAVLGFETDDPSAWRLHHFEPASGFMGAVACRTGGLPLTVTVSSWPVGR